jgi:hypothetical protein
MNNNVNEAFASLPPQDSVYWQLKQALLLSIDALGDQAKQQALMKVCRDNFMIGMDRGTFTRMVDEVGDWIYHLYCLFICLFLSIRVNVVSFCSLVYLFLF